MLIARAFPIIQLYTKPKGAHHGKFKSHFCALTSNAIHITLSQLPKLKANQKVNVTVTCSFSEEPPKNVLIQRFNCVVAVKEDIIAEDPTATASLHLQVEVGIDEEKETILLSAFTEVIQALLSKFDATLESETDCIEDALLDMQNITIFFNPSKQVVTKVVSVSDVVVADVADVAAQ
eukprot:gene13446-biopygen10747